MTSVSCRWFPRPLPSLTPSLKGYNDQIRIYRSLYVKVQLDFEIAVRSRIFSGDHFYIARCVWVRATAATQTIDFIFRGTLNETIAFSFFLAQGLTKTCNPLPSPFTWKTSTSHGQPVPERAEFLWLSIRRRFICFREASGNGWTSEEKKEEEEKKTKTRVISTVQIKFKFVGVLCCTNSNCVCVVRHFSMLTLLVAVHQTTFQPTTVVQVAVDVAMVQGLQCSLRVLDENGRRIAEHHSANCSSRKTEPFVAYQSGEEPSRGEVQPENGTSKLGTAKSRNVTFGDVVYAKQRCRRSIGRNKVRFGYCVWLWGHYPAVFI